MSESSEKGSRKGSKKDSENRASVSASFRVGDFVGNDYELLKELGRGGMGVVFEARHRFIGQPVALKVLYPHLLTEENWQRFVREARALGRLDHPGIVKIFNCGIDAERAAPFYVMELIEGDSLSDLVDVRGALPEELAIKAAIEAAKALHFAHGMGVVHRDVKPSNFILPHSASGSSLNLKVLDFGIAALSSDRLSSKEKQKLTATGQIFGTPYYMSPEVVTGQAASPLSDVYSLGCTLFEMLSGQVPYKGESIFETLGMHMSAPVPSLSETSGHEFSSELELLVARALAKSPRERYSSMQMFAVDLERYLDCRPVYGTGIKSEGFANLEQITEIHSLEPKERSLINTWLFVLCTLFCIFFVGSVVFFFFEPSAPQKAPRASRSEDVRSSEPSAALLIARRNLWEEKIRTDAEITDEDRSLIRRGYEIERLDKAIKYKFPSREIGEIWMPGSARPAKGEQIIALSKGGKYEFVVFADIPKEFVAGLKPNSFDLQLRFNRDSDLSSAVKYTQGWSSLKHVCLEHFVLGSGVKVLDRLPPCKNFTVSHCSIDFPLFDCRQLRSAQALCFNSVSGPELKGIFAVLAQIESLEALQLSGMNLSEEEADGLASAMQLKSLVIQTTDVSPAQLVKLMRLPKLETLKVLDCLFRPAEISQALKGCPNRRKLKLSLTSPNLSTKNLEKIEAAHLMLKKPTFSWTKADMAAMRRLVGELEICDIESIKAEGVKGYVSLSDL